MGGLFSDEISARISELRAKAAEVVAGKPRTNAPTFIQNITKSRQTHESSDDFGFGMGNFGNARFRPIIPPPSYQKDWLLLDIDNFSIDTVDPEKILLIIKAVCPPISKAHWDFQQFCNNQWSWKCESGPDSVGTSATNKFFEILTQTQQGFDVILNKIVSGGFLRGAIASELALYRRKPVDLIPFDPVIVRWGPAKNRARGEHEVMGQRYDGKFLEYKYGLVRYHPINTQIGTNYGIPMIDTSIFSAIFMMGLLYDIRRVIAQQGYYRLDFSLDWEVMQEKIDRNRVEPGEVDAFIQTQLDKLREYYDQLGPNDSIAHTSDILVDDIGGALNTEGLGSLNAIIDWLNNQLTLACKTVPILMGINNSTSETHANRQWENYMATIRSVQRSMTYMLEYQFNRMHRVLGIQDRHIFQFQELSLTTAINQAVYENQKLANIEKALNMHVKGMDAEGKETIETPVPLMTPEEAALEWQQTRELR